jgi:hypothetical protein
MYGIEESQRQFYREKFLKFGDDPRALSWNDRNSQYLRFKRICDLFKYERDCSFTVHEIGCGLGHFKEYLDLAGYSLEYSGSDIVPDFIEHNKKKYPDYGFYLQSVCDEFERIDDRVKGKDYYFLNGSFHTKEDNTVEDWEAFVFKSMWNMFRMAGKGICVSFLTAYSGFFQDRLYYADPGRLLGYVIEHMSRFVTISHDIPLFEFFVFAYKENFIKTQFPDFERYFGVL